MKKYYLTNHFKIIFGGIWLLPLVIVIPLCIVIYFIAMPTKFWALMSILGVFSSIAGAIRMAYSEYIILSENDITYHTFAFSIKANWVNVETIILGKWWFFKQEGIMSVNTTAKMKSESSLAFNAAKNGDIKRFIPLSCFAENWRESELGQQIKQYAPHLFK